MRPGPRGGDVWQKVRFGPYEADFGTGELRKYGNKIKVQGKPLAVLALLVENQGQVVTRQQLQKALWPDDVFVDYEKNLNTAVNKLRDVLCDTAERPRYIETIPRRGYRFIVPVQSVSAEHEVAPPTVPMPTEVGPPPDVNLNEAARRRRRGWWTVGVLVGGAVFAATALLPGFRAGRAVLNERDTVVLADFENATRDAVFDGTLRQGLASQLEQSHFLNVLSDARVALTLGLMERRADTRLTSEVSRAVCVRTGSVATIEGSIANFGGQYVMWLRAVNCKTGEPIANEQVSAPSKDKVLPALASAATSLRRKLGDSLPSAEKPDVPPESVTTNSLEALHAYSLGYRSLVVSNESAPAIAFFQNAIGLDPNFAMAYARLGKCYDAVDQFDMAAENFRKAHDLRDRASERERFYIDAYYEYVVTGRLEAARQRFQSWAETYPDDARPHASLGNIYADLGDYEKARSEREEALRLDAAIGLNYGNLIWSNVGLGRFERARSLAREAQSRHLDSPSIHLALYWAAWAERDAARSEREAQGLMGRPGAEEAILIARQMEAAHAGRFARATEFARRAADTHLRHNEPEGAARVEARLALDHAMVGIASAAKVEAEAALSHSKSKDVQAGVAIARAITGDTADASRMAAALESNYPEHTVVQRNYLPAIRAAIALERHRPDHAIEALESATPYERGKLGYFMLPIYLRGQALLERRDGAGAAREFGKILGFPGPVPDLVGALAHLGIARAYNVQGDTPKAQTAYDAFLSIWRDADSTVPLLRAAAAERARLR